jgi:hypothetical protein
VQFRDPELKEHRHRPLAKLGGWADYAVWVGDVEGVHQETVNAGWPASNIIKRERLQSNGETVLAYIAVLGRGYGDPIFPMLIEDKTRRSLRLPEFLSRTHANGATSAQGITFITANLDEAKSNLSRYFPLISAEKDRARFQVGHHWVEVIHSKDANTTEGQRVAQIGTCIASVTIKGPNGEIVLDNNI